MTSAALTTTNNSGSIRVICSLIALFPGVKYIYSFSKIISTNPYLNRTVPPTNYLVIAYRNLIPTRKNLITTHKNFFNPYTHVIFTYKNLITTCKLIAQAMGFIFFNAPGNYQSAWLRNDAGLCVLHLQNNSRTLTIHS